MLDRLAELFGGTPDLTPSQQPSGQLALAALLVEAARQDGHYDAAERAAILRILRLEHDLSAADAETLCREAESAQESAVDLFRFTYALKQSTEFEERSRMIEHVWEIVLADGERDDAEDALVRKLCGLLGVPDRESGLARQRVAARRESEA